MNKALFEKVKAKCKNTGLSEKYLTTVTEKMGGGIEDDSTDETAIENTANQISEVAALAQPEATRWANKKEGQKEPGKDSDKDKEKENTDKDSDIDPFQKKIQDLEKELNEMKEVKSKEQRQAAINSAIAKHKIPDWRTKGLMVPDDVDPDTFMAEIHQDLVTRNLIPADTEGAKEANEKAVDQAADDLLKSITAK